MSDGSIASQLELLGLDEMRRRADSEPSPMSRARMLQKIEQTHEILTALPEPTDLNFLHSGLCQTHLPHSRLEKNSSVWRRRSGAFTLMVTPGVVDRSTLPGPAKKGDIAPDSDQECYVGVPYGTKARLIMIHLQTEGVKGRTVSLGPSLSAFLRSLRLPVSGGPRGSIQSVKEQCLRIARCTFTLQWTGIGVNGSHTVITDSKIVDGLEMWNSSREDWSGVVELGERFYEHLREHAVPLDKRAIAMLAGNSLGLDLYALFVYRLPRLTDPVHLSWAMLKEQIGTEYAATNSLGRKVREVMPSVKDAYPHANIELTRHGILMKNSKPAVPKTTVQGFTIVEG